MADMSKFEFNLFVQETVAYENCFNRCYTRGVRLGQHYYNKLHEMYPDLARKIKGTSLDPFYMDFKVPEFLEFLYRCDGLEIDKIEVKK